MRTVQLTPTEIDIIAHALKIAAEDGSIYTTELGNDAEQDAADKKMNAAMEGILKKLGRQG